LVKKQQIHSPKADEEETFNAKKVEAFGSRARIYNSSSEHPKRITNQRERGREREEEG